MSLVETFAGIAVYVDRKTGATCYYYHHFIVVLPVLELYAYSETNYIRLNRRQLLLVVVSVHTVL